jgi:hypothetical protein
MYMQMMVVTELCDGGDLAKAIRQHRGSDVMSWYTRGAKLSLDIACGLAYLHSKRVSVTASQACTLHFLSFFIVASGSPKYV